MTTIHPAGRFQFGAIVAMAGVLVCSSCHDRTKDGTPAVSQAPSTDSTVPAGSGVVDTGAAIREQIMTLTPQAAERLRILRDQKLKKNAVVRFQVIEGKFFRLKGGGEKRYRYKIRIDDDFKDWENVYVMESQGFTVLVDKDSAEFLRGTELWWIESGGKGGFKFQNPNELGADAAAPKGELTPETIVETTTGPTPTPIEK